MTTTGFPVIEKSDLEASKFIQWRREVDKKSKTILLHTRFATKGSFLNMDNNHPIEYGNSIVIHNGHISNDDSLFKTENMERIAEVDSEIIAALFNKYGLQKAHIPLQKLDGNYAVAVVDKRNPNSLVLAKGHNSPLIYLVHEGALIWASTEHAIKGACDKILGFNPTWKELNSLKTGELLYIENGKIESLSFKPLEKEYNKTFSHGRDNKPWNYSKKYGTGWSLYEDDKDEKVIDASMALPIKLDPKMNAPWKTEVNGLETWLVSCSECMEAVRLSQAIKIDDYHFCDTCYIISDYVADVVDNSHVENSAEEINKILGEEHEAVIELVAEKHSQSFGFVEWILFDAKDDVINSSEYLQIHYIDLSESYDEIYEELLSEEEDTEDENFTETLQAKEDLNLFEENVKGFSKRMTIKKMTRKSKKEIGL
jgi:hypothetical protein